MKTFCITLLITMFFSFTIRETYAQTTETKLNQVELMKQFIGTWECELGKRTIYRSDNKQFGNGMACIIQVISNGEIVDSVEQLFGYDANTDKFVLTELVKSSSIVEISSAWFTSEHAGEIVTTDPDSEKKKFNFEFITPDLIKETATLDNNIVVEMEFNRVK